MTEAEWLREHGGAYQRRNIAKGLALSEAEWLQCPNAAALLSHLRRQRGVLRTKWGRRKVWLFIAACFRSSWHLLSHDARAVVELYERHADNPLSKAELNSPREAMFEAYKAMDSSSKSKEAKKRDWLQFALWQMTLARTTQEAVRAVYEWDAQAMRYLKEWPHFADLLRDIFGNPFRPVALNLSWLTPTVKALAQSIHDDHNFTDFPVLADALEESGCTNADILDHCRTEGPHFRGCWVVDLILGKE